MLNKITILFLLIFISGCSSGVDIEKSEKIVDKYYKTLSEGSTEEVLDMLPPEIFENQSREELAKYYRRVKYKLGKYKTRELVWKQEKSGVGVSSSDRVYNNLVLVYDVYYSKNMSKETFVFIGKDNPKLIGHTIKSNEIF